jgi:hypothetical protein
MNRYRWFSSLVLLVGLGACDLAVFTAGSDDDVLLRSGTSFGMCVGYCVAELVVHEADVTLTRTSRDPANYPAATQSLRLTASELRALRSAIASSDLRSSQGVHGCPDCADGGAEWVDVDGNQVMFEYGADIEAIRPLLHEIRKLRTRFAP